jgi:DNA-binding transcriptional MerR regulator
MQNDDEFITSSKVCSYLGISITLLNSLEKSGHLVPARKMPLSNKRLYRMQDVENFRESVQVNGKERNL